MQPGIKLVPKNKLPPNTEILSKHIAEGGPTMYARRKAVDAPTFKSGGTQVVGAQGVAVADASGGATVDAEARAAINALLARLRAHGLIAT